MIILRTVCPSRTTATVIVRFGTKTTIVREDICPFGINSSPYSVTATNDHSGVVEGWLGGETCGWAKGICAKVCKMKGLGETQAHVALI